MKALFIGGTGTISMAITRQLLLDKHDLWLLNRGNRDNGGAKQLKLDINDEKSVAEAIKNEHFDVVADFIAFKPEQVERDFRLFAGKCSQYIFISSASAYQKPVGSYLITESTPLANPFWQYSRNKIACEDFLMEKYRENGFPVTIIRPSHTYDERSVPLGVHGAQGSWQVIKRMMTGKPVIVHGDGTSLWHMTQNRDFARAFIGLMHNIRAIGEAVQITGDETLSWNQIYHCIYNALNINAEKNGKGRLPPLEMLHFASEFLAAHSKKCGLHYDFTGGLIGDKANSVVFDNTKLKRLVPGYHSKIRFDQGVQETIDYCLAHPECQKEDPDFDRWCDTLVDIRKKALA
ncbi:MAG: NAD-dependent epimerase/dehydratase family protein [Spirochaetaceae bacterium]|jgi:nucleoside-diphosphate-sugar epimerase|nr:NAD-dependent epimerase/dehydratase family protein [Spirochaetaceae bacterium]